MNTKQVTILRGPSGSGKSTYAKNLDDVRIVSADDFFMKRNPETNALEYQFDPTKLARAHNDCFRRFLIHLQQEVKHVVVDNTNIHAWEYDNYREVAAMMGYRVEIVIFQPTTLKEIKLCIRRTTHRVPAEIIMRMGLEFEIHDTPAEVTHMPISD